MNPLHPIPDSGANKVGVFVNSVGSLAAAIQAERGNAGSVQRGSQYAGAPTSVTIDPECSEVVEVAPVEAIPEPVYARPPAYAALYQEGDEFSNLGTGTSATRGFMRLATLRNVRNTASVGSQGFDLTAIKVWQTTNGALTGSALIAILKQCMVVLGEVGPECLAAVRAGAGEFAAVPENARRELVQMYRGSHSCRTGGDACVEELQNAAKFRALPRGGLLLSPLKMKKGKRSLFTATIRDSGEIEGRPGRPSDFGIESVPGRPGQEREITVAPYSPEMCFVLKSDDPTKAVIEPRPGDRRTVKLPSRVCMKAADGMGAIKYDPSWWVTPLSSGKLNLSLDIEHFDDRGRMQNFPQEPRPIEIEVMGWWDELDAFLERATGTANLATALAKAIGALFTAIAAWGIWKLFKRRRSGDAPPP